MNSEPVTQDSSLNFECLVFDLKNQCFFGNDINSFFKAILSNISIFPNSDEVNIKTKTEKTIIAQCKNLSITITKLSNELGNLDYSSGFYLLFTFSGFDLKTKIHVEEIDRYRMKIATHLVDLKFTKIFILRDDFSSFLLQKIYVSLNKIENHLRSYIIKKFTLSEGVGYATSKIFNSKQKEKTRNRGNDENIFSKLSTEEDLIDSKIYLVDFGDLGDIIKSSAFSNLKAEDIVNQISQAADLETLKKGVESHTDKYFTKFKEIKFEEKWQFLKNIRDKVAHNGLTKLEEISIAETYLKELIDFLQIENSEIIKIPQKFQDIEKFTSTLNIGVKEITKNELLKELNTYKKWSESSGRGFFGLKNFLYNIIGSKGYRIGDAWDILEELQSDGYISMDMWKDPTGKYPDQKQISFLKQLPSWISE